MNADCHICLGPHDEAMHQASLNVRAWLLDQIFPQPIAQGPKTTRALRPAERPVVRRHRKFGEEPDGR